MLPEIKTNLEVLTRHGSSNNCVVLLHGYGANNQDLYPLNQMIRSLDDATWFFPNAPHALEMGPLTSGRAWFPIDQKALEVAMVTGIPRDYSTLVPEGMLEASEMVTDLCQQLTCHYEKVFIGGFSQGAMISVETILNIKNGIDALFCFSGTLVCQKRWEELAKNHGPINIFQSHGKDDPLLSFDYANNLNQFFQTIGGELSYVPFQGGHEIPPEVLFQWEQFLKNHLF
ncbi:MAG: hypothetical protein HOE90_20290 [Bacteriovoracaceae bacterium]|nr:hypothetical protein [Bacteriovoracaceae bacterium]